MILWLSVAWAGELERDCIAGDAEACALRADQLLDRKKLGDAAAFYKSACNGGIGRACNNLGLLILDEKVKRDEDPVELFELGCDNFSVTSCHNFGVELYQGVNVERDLPEAAARLALACTPLRPNSCHALGRVQEARQQLGDANITYRDACKGGSDWACRDYMRMRLHPLGEQLCREPLPHCLFVGVDPNDVNHPKHSERLHERLCELGVIEACGNLGWNRLVSDPEGGRQLLRDACDAGSEPHCAVLERVQ